MVFDSAFFETCRGVDRVLVGDVDNALHAVWQHLRAVFLHEDFGSVLFVYFSHGFHGPEDAADGLGDCGRVLPFDEVLDVPFAGDGEMLELPAK